MGFSSQMKCLNTINVLRHNLISNKFSVNMTFTRCYHRFKRVSRLFPHTRGDQASTIGCRSQKLMLQNQLVVGAAPGTFYILPHTLRSLEKLHRLIDRSMSSIDGQKVSMPCIATEQMWKQSGRWDEMGDELFTFKGRNNSSYCLAPTHEEAVASIVASESPISYKRLPIKLYQIGRKFRDEMRPKNGLLRCKEFEMKDLYTFDSCEETARISYTQVCEAYVDLFNQLDIPYLKVSASSGAMGGSQSQEFHCIADIGEDTLITCDKCSQSFNMELKDSLSCQDPACPKSFTEQTGIEVAHAFLLGTRYSQTFKAFYTSKEQKRLPLYMGCFGIGVTRLLAAALEVLSSETEIRWPKLIAPYQVTVIPQKDGYKSDVTNELAEKICDHLCSTLPSLDGEILLDDRTNFSIGRRINWAKQMGLPYVISVGKKALSSPPLYELIDVYSPDTEPRLCTQQELCDALSSVRTVLL